MAERAETSGGEFRVPPARSSDSGKLAASAWRLTLERKLAFAFLGTLLVVIALTLAVADTARRAVESGRQVAHTHEVLDALERIVGTVAQIEAAAFGFAITAEDKYLGNRDSALSLLESRNQKLSELIADNPEQLRRWKVLAHLLDERLAALDRLVVIRQTENADAVRWYAEWAFPNNAAATLRKALDEMRGEEQRLLAQRMKLDEQRRLATIVAGFVLAAIFVLLLTIGYVTVRRQLSARVEAERQERETNLFLDSVIENIPNMIFVKDARDLKFVRFNRAGEELLGHSRDDLIGKSDYDFFPKADADFFMEKDRQVLASGALLDIPEERIETRDRGPRLLHTRKLPILSSEGKPLYLLGISADVTERRRAEGEIRVLNSELQGRAAQLEAANRELESFSYSVSHDLRAPLRAIVGFSRMLVEDHAGQIDEEALRKLNVIQAEAHRMGQLIDELLAFSRLGRKAMSQVDLDMTELVRTTYAGLNGHHEESNVELHLGSLPRAKGDRVLLGQVWANLLSNAVKFSSKREKPLVEVSAISDEKEHIYFVRDNGAGFDPRYQSKLFGVFQRLHHTSEFPGTGVGLALVQRIVARHGGRVWADGKPGEGATFYFTLPREDSDGAV